ncbi:MAG: DUF177 domain-containing protein [Fusobacteriota bacterium]
MIITISDLKKEDNIIEVQDELKVSVDEKEVKVKPNIIVTLVSDDEIAVNGSLEYVRELTCVKCLKKFKKDLYSEINTIFMPEAIYNEEIEAESNKNGYNPDEPINEKLTDDQIDLTKLIREYLLLETPEYPKCSKDCTGLEEMKDYDNKGMDPRWQQLLDITNEK